MRLPLAMPLLLALVTTGSAHAVEPAVAPPPPPMDTTAPPREAALPPIDTDAPPSRPPGDSLPQALTLPPEPGSAPAVSIRTEQNGDVVEEYRQNGRVTMVKVRPKVGIEYTMMDTNGDGRLDRSDSDGPVGPVYYTIYEWD